MWPLLEEVDLHHLYRVSGLLGQLQEEIDLFGSKSVPTLDFAEEVITVVRFVDSELL